MITVHHLENSQSIRILWLLEELGVAYHIQQYRRIGPLTLAPDSYKRLHPLGKSPTISDGGLVLAETNAIVDYLLDRFSEIAAAKGLRPEPGSPGRTAYLYWLHATQGSFMPLLLDSLMFKRLASRVPRLLGPLMKRVSSNVHDRYLTPNLNNMLALVDETLSQSTWLAGESLTAADIVMGYCLCVAEVRVGLGQQYPSVCRFLQQMRARSAYQAAVAKGGAFSPLAS